MSSQSSWARSLLLLLAAIFFFASATLPYTPPVDTAGPLTVRIQEPALGNYGAGGLARLTQPGVPFTINVSLENAGDSALEGTLRLQVIDRWKADPSAPQPFKVEARGRARFSYTVSFGEGTFNAHYPVHAFAEFQHQGRTLVAHPILILTTQLPNPPRARLPVEWKPVAVSAKGGAMALWRLPVRRESARVTVDDMLAAPPREPFEATPAVQYGARIERGTAREAVVMLLGRRAPSLRERVESALAEYPLLLPKTRPIRLQFGNAVAGSEPSAGAAMFRVRVLPFNAPPGQEGKVVFERRVDTTVWLDADADLSPFAGQEVRLQLEAAGDVTAYWSEPAVVTGRLSPAIAFPPAAGAASRLLGTVEQGGQKYEVRHYDGRRGLLDAAVGFSNAGRQLYFRGFHVRVFGDALEDWQSSSELIEARVEPADGRYRVRHRFASWAGNFDVLGELWVDKTALRARFWMENAPPPRPWLHAYLEEVTAGPWSEQAKRVYAGPGNVVQDPQAFQLGFDGHRLATSFVGFEFPGGFSLVQAVDSPPTRLDVDPGNRVYSLNTPHPQTMTFVPAAGVWDAVKIWREGNGLKASAGVPKLAGRFVFDLWGAGRGYAASAQALERAFRYGLTDSVVVWHTWQRWGYDYRLPDLYPPNPQYGTLEDFVKLAQVCKKNGVYFAPHDNYIDFYPDSEGFTYDNIVFNRDGTPYRAWFNSGRQAQSYRSRPDKSRPFLERNLRLVRDGIAPTSWFIDVWSSMGPYDYWTSEGQFFDRTVTRKEWREAFAWIRDFLGNDAPQISEAGHDQLIGWLDGAQCNHLRVDVPPASGFIWPIRASDAERVPWFDAAYHHLFVLHGAGYEDRYVSGLDRRAHGMYSDDYITTEIMTGHPTMVSVAFSRDVVRKYWLTHDTMSGLGLKRMDRFEFAGDNLHRQRIAWEGGAQVLVNRSPEDWTEAGHTLPQYGFYARVPVAGGVAEAAIERLEGQTVEWARSPSVLYYNARRDGGTRGQPVSFGGVATDGAFRLTRDAEGLRLTPLPEGGQFVARMRWNTLPWAMQEPVEAQVLDENGNVIRRAPIAADQGVVTLACVPGVFAYRLR